MRALGGRQRARLGHGRLERDGRGVADRGDRRASRIATVRGSRSTPPSWRRTARSTSPPGTSTTSPSPATRSTPRTARASSPGARTGSTPAGRTSRAAARCATSPPTASNGRPARHATKEAPRRRSAPSRSPPRSARSARRAGSSIEAHEQELLERLLTGLDAISGVRTYELWERGHDRVGVVSFNVADLDPALLAAALGAEHGIGVRDGAFCAHPLMDHFAARDNGSRHAVRASIGVGTSAHDIDRLLEAVEQHRPPRHELELRRARRLRPSRPRPASAPVARRPAQRPGRRRRIGLSRIAPRRPPRPRGETRGRDRVGLWVRRRQREGDRPAVVAGAQRIGLLDELLERDPDLLVARRGRPGGLGELDPRSGSTSGFLPSSLRLEQPAMWPNSQQASVSMAPFTGRTAKLDACVADRPVEISLPLGHAHRPRSRGVDLGRVLRWPHPVRSMPSFRPAYNTGQARSERPEALHRKADRCSTTTGRSCWRCSSSSCSSPGSCACSGSSATSSAATTSAAGPRPSG